MSDERPDRPDPAERRVLYGRRRGRPFRKGQQHLWETLLPRLRVELPPPGETIDIATLLPPGCDRLAVEIGYGGGEHLVAQALARPETLFIGCEVFENGIAKLLAEIDRRRIGNIRLLVEDGRRLLAALPPRSLTGAFILFPDPWPKQRHHKRRLVSTETLDLLAQAMPEGAELRIATDDPSYQLWMLQRVPVHPGFRWLAEGPSDWRSRPEDWPQTRYEAKALRAGRRPLFLRLRRRVRPHG